MEDEKRKNNSVRRKLAGELRHLDGTKFSIRQSQSERREDRTARTIIAKLVAFLFVQILSVRIQNLHNVPVLLPGTG